MSTSDAQAYLRTFPDFERGNVSAAQTFGLERVLALLEEVGSPHLCMPVVHIAGTKGKGSTSVSVASILTAAGYRTGLFTQPHLVRLNERFQIDMAEIDDDALSEVVLEHIRPAMDRLEARGITGVQQFEAQVALAFLWFEHEAVDVTVLEVGLGGRLDATNVVPQPLVTTITPIGFDHMAILGNTLPLIAGEKAAIIKDRVPVVAAPQPSEAAAVIAERSLSMRAPLYLGGRDWAAMSVDSSLTGTSFDLNVTASLAREAPRWSDHVSGASTGPENAFSVIRLSTPLLGAHQAVNAACAVVTAIVATSSLSRIDIKAIRSGLASVEWSGRLEIIDSNPTVVVDGAHTAESAEALVHAVGDLFLSGCSRSVVVVCGIQADKDIPSIAAPLSRLATYVVATRAGHQRAAPADRIAAAFRAAGSVDVRVRESPLAALDLAQRLAGSDGLVVVTGSLYLVGDILATRPARRLERAAAL